MAPGTTLYTKAQAECVDRGFAWGGGSYTGMMSGSMGINHTFTFKDGRVETPYILNKTDSAYLAFIKSKDEEARNGYFNGWKPGGGDQSKEREFGIPEISPTPVASTNNYSVSYPSGSFDTSCDRITDSSKCGPTPYNCGSWNPTAWNSKTNSNTGSCNFGGYMSGGTTYGGGAMFGAGTCSDPKINDVLSGTSERGMEGNDHICFGSGMSGTNNKYVRIPTGGVAVKTETGAIKVFDCATNPIPLCSSPSNTTYYGGGTMSGNSGAEYCATGPSGPTAEVQKCKDNCYNTANQAAYNSNSCMGFRGAQTPVSGSASCGSGQNWVPESSNPAGGYCSSGST